MSVAVGTILDQYEILALPGKGGMGEVYRARDSKLKRGVAIKTISIMERSSKKGFGTEENFAGTTAPKFSSVPN